MSSTLADPQVSSPSKQRSSKRFAIPSAIVFGVLLIFPVWVVRYPPLLDYPNHLASTYILGHLRDPARNFSSEFTSVWGLNPYVAVDFTLTELGRVISPYAAGKLVLSFGLLGLPAAAWFFLRQANPGNDALAVWALLIAHNIFFFYGFMGYFCSITFVFLTLGLWIRWLQRQTFLRWFLTCLSLTAAYFTHVFGWIFLGYIIGILSLTRPKLREWFASALLFLPSGIMYIVSSRAASLQKGAEFRPVLEKLESFWYIIHGYSTWLNWVSIAAFVLLFLFGWWRNPEFHWNRRLVYASAGMLLAYLALPIGYGDGWNIDIRALPVLFVVLLASVNLGKRAWVLAPIAVLLFVLRVGTITRYFEHLQPELAGVAKSFAMTSENAKILPVVETSGEDPIFQFYGHFWAYGVIDRGWYSPYMFQLPGLLPLKMTMELYDPDGFWDQSYDGPLDWKQIRTDYDYVWAWDVDKFESGLDSVGDEIYTFDRLTLYKIRK
jgi:hypothetical protein